MTVYIVIGHDYDMSNVLGVFSSEDDAEAFAAGHDWEFNCGVNIEEHEVK